MQFLIALDQLLNTLVWIRTDGFGYADETLSARAWRLRARSRAYQVIDTLFFWQSHHCRAAYRAEQQRHQLPKDYR